MKKKRLSIHIIRLDFQPSENLIEETVCGMVMALQSEEKLPPVRVRFDGTNYFLEDGFHRLEAFKRMGIEKVKAEVSPGTLADMEREWREQLEIVKASLRGQGRSK